MKGSDMTSMIEDLESIRDTLNNLSGFVPTRVFRIIENLIADLKRFRDGS